MVSTGGGPANDDAGLVNPPMDGGLDGSIVIVEENQLVGTQGMKLAQQELEQMFAEP